MFCLYTLPLTRPAQAKIQMLRAICSISKSELSVLFGAMLLVIGRNKGVFLLKTTLYACTAQYLMGSSMKPQNCSTQPTQNTFLILKAQKD